MSLPETPSPWLRTPTTQVTSLLVWEGKDLLDTTGAPVTSSSKQVHLATLGLNGNHQDAWWDGGVTAWNASLVSGKLSLDAATLAIDSASAQSSGHFTRATYSLSRLQRLGQSDSVSLAVSGQLANKNLGSSEKFALGGASGVRAYPQGEGSGDEGWMVNLELRHEAMQGLQGVAFYDLGSVTVNHHPFVPTPNLRNIAGAGLGLNAQYADVQLKAAVAWRTEGGAAKSEPATMNRNPRLWIQASAQF